MQEACPGKKRRQDALRASGQASATEERPGENRGAKGAFATANLLKKKSGFVTIRNSVWFLFSWGWRIS
jgi:hypothetical protein